MMEYKGYIGTIEFDDEADILQGEVINIRDVVTFEGRNVRELKNAFRDSIEDYLAFCTERGEEPDKPLPDKLLPELHGKLFIKAKLAEKDGE